MLPPLLENERWVQWERKQVLGLTEFRRVRTRFDEGGFVERVSAERLDHHFHFFKAEEVAELDPDLRS